MPRDSPPRRARSRSPGREPERPSRQRDDKLKFKGDDKASSNKEEKPKKPKKEKKEKVEVPTEKMIIVHVNDRLGTKAAIPCLPSDPISE